MTSFLPNSCFWLEFFLSPIPVGSSTRRCSPLKTGAAQGLEQGAGAEQGALPGRLTALRHLSGYVLFLRSDCPWVNSFKDLSVQINSQLTFRSGNFCSSLAVLEQAEGSIVQERLYFLTQFCKKPVFPLLNEQTKVLQKKSVASFTIPHFSWILLRGILIAIICIFIFQMLILVLVLIFSYGNICICTMQLQQTCVFRQ